MKKLLTWLKKPNPVKLWKRKRARDRVIQRIEAKQQAEEYGTCVEKEAYLLWEADGKPEGKDDYYWTKAIEKIELKKIPTIYKPYYFLEKRVLEPVDAWIKRQASISIFSQLAILAAIVAFIGGENVRRNNEVFAAWQTITSAEGQSGNGGRIEALQFLNSRPLRFPWIGWTKEDWYWDERQQKCKLKRLIGRRWKREPLVGLSAPDAYLANIHLCGANLIEADLRGADLKGADLSRADLDDADLSEAQLWDADLSGADLSRADLIFVYLSGTNLNGVDFSEASLLEAEFREMGAGQVRNLTPKQIKSACYWETARFDPEFEEKLKKEPDQEVDCLYWELKYLLMND